MSRRPANRLALIFLLGALFVLPGCTTRVMVDYEEGTNFRAFRTYRIEARPETGASRDVVLSPIVDRRIERSLASGLRTRGLRPDELNPDLLVFHHTVTRTRTQVNTWTTGGAWWGHYNHGFRGSHTFVDVEEFEEGTFIIDLVDARTRELVWRGASPERLGWDAPSQADIDAIVTRILENYPPDGVIGPGLGLTQETIPSV